MGIIYKNGIPYGNQPNGTVPSGGTTGQVLKKKSNTDYDTEWANESGGGGTSDYTDLTNKPQINGVTLTGNKSLSDIGAASQSDLEDLEDITGDGQLSGFTATDLTGAANELKNTLNSEIATRQTYVRPNLLDNWYFINPVNQRGQTSYSNAGYTIDRWKLTSGSVEVVSGGITLNGTLVQILEASIGQTVTASALLSDGSMITPTYNDTTKTFTLTATGQTIKAVKLELGSGQTLAHNEDTGTNPVWVLNEIPDYGEQLMKCLRYLQYLPKLIRMRAVNIINRSSENNTAVDFLPPLKQPFAASPSMSGGSWNMLKFGGSTVSYNSVALANSTKDVVNIRVTVALNAVTDAQLYSSTDVMFSCEP